MKALSTKQALSFILTASLILGSCTSYKQVACPEIDQNNYLARTTNKIKTKTPHRTRQTYAKNLDKLSANKFDTKRPRSSRNSVTLTTVDRAPELSPVSMIGGQIETRDGLDQNLLASTDNRSVQSGISEKAGEQMKISTASRAYVNSGSLELMSPKELRKFNRRFARELRSSMQVAPRAAGPASTGKPAKQRWYSVSPHFCFCQFSRVFWGLFSAPWRLSGSRQIPTRKDEGWQWQDSSAAL